MKAKLLNLGLILSSLIGYLEWGEDQHMFLIEGEIDVLYQLFTDPASVAHPLIFLPLIGQILLIITLFQKSPGKWLTYIGMGCLACLLLLMLFIGIISTNFKILFSTLPFIVVSIMVVRNNWR